MALKISIMICIVLLSTCGDAQQIEQEDLIGTWNHSIEEQTDDIQVFRPEGYELPRVRGRESMEFKKGGTYVLHEIAPADGYLDLEGSFELDGENDELKIAYTKSDKQYVKHYKIVKLTTDILMLKPVGD